MRLRGHFTPRSHLSNFPLDSGGRQWGEWEVWGRVEGVVMAHKLWKQSRRSIYFVAEKCPQHFSSSSSRLALPLSRCRSALSLSPTLFSCCPFLTLLLLCFVNVVPQKQLKAVPRHFTSFDDVDDICATSLGSSLLPLSFSLPLSISVSYSPLTLFTFGADLASLFFFCLSVCALW